MTYIRMAVKQDNKVQKVCFTLNNPEPGDYEKITEHGRNKCRFMVVGREVGENGTPHLQGYANFAERTRFTALKKFLPRAHFDKAMGTDEQNLAYCTKQDKNAFVFGEPQRSGKRNDLKPACDAILQKKTMAEVAVAHPEIFVKYHRGLEALASLIYKPRDRNDPPTVLWLWGAAGVGKTRFVWDNFPEDQIYSKDDTTLWWDGYTQQQCILIDDFENKWSLHYLLKVLDRYPFRVQIKGGFVQLNSPFIIITCDHPPDYFWVDNELSQVTRRISHTFHMEQKK